MRCFHLTLTVRPASANSLCPVSVFDGMRLVPNAGEVSAECWIMPGWGCSGALGFFFCQCSYRKGRQWEAKTPWPYKVCVCDLPLGKETRGVSICFCPLGWTWQRNKLLLLQIMVQYVYRNYLALLCLNMKNDYLHFMVTYINVSWVSFEFHWY